MATNFIENKKFLLTTFLLSMSLILSSNIVHIEFMDHPFLFIYKIFGGIIIIIIMLTIIEGLLVKIGTSLFNLPSSSQNLYPDNRINYYLFLSFVMVLFGLNIQFFGSTKINSINESLFYRSVVYSYFKPEGNSSKEYKLASEIFIFNDGVLLDKEILVSRVYFSGKQYIDFFESNDDIELTKFNKPQRLIDKNMKVYTITVTTEELPEFERKKFLNSQSDLDGIYRLVRGRY